jgi:outer membrane lipoprotein-sorting protein
MPSKWTRWIPAALVPVVVVAGVVLVPIAADATPALPEKSPQQLLEFVSGSADTPYSGTVEQKSNLGLPDLSSFGSSYRAESAESAAVDLLTGSTSARVFVGGADAARIQVTDTLAERDVIRNGDEAWTYDSRSNSVQHLTSGGAPSAGMTSTPAELAARFIAAIEPTTTVTVTDTARVAGRAVYRLVLTPDDASTLVGSVTLSVDSETGVPLDVRVFAAGQSDTAQSDTAQSDAAFSVGFSSIDFGAQDASLFSFTPPPGSTVEEHQADELDHIGDAAPDGADDPDSVDPEVTGTGWSTIVELPAGSATDLGDSSALLDRVLVPVDGGRALTTTLVSVLLTDDGRVLAGAVGIDQLLAAAAR